MAIKRREKKGFQGIDLNEDCVRGVFDECGTPKEDGHTEWNEEMLKQYQEHIRYMFGQLSLVHNGVEEHELDSTFFKKYDGKMWTDNGEFLIDLLNMGAREDICSFFETDDKQFVQLNSGLLLMPTLSPKDPKFAAWWESADGLIVQALIAYNGDKLEAALSLYEKAAKMGSVEAHFRCSNMYFYGKGTTVDKVKSLYWLEKAAQQGDKKAQYQTGFYYAFGIGTKKDSKEALKWFQASANQGYKRASIPLNLMCKKGILGTKVADLEAKTSKLIDRYETTSYDEEEFLLDTYVYLSRDMRIKIDNGVQQKWERVKKQLGL